jgi:transitional endoplasmic reticulum ATPase
MTEDGEIEELFAGQAAKVLAVSPDGDDLHVVFRNGNTGRVTLPTATDLMEGDIVLLGERRWERAPTASWTDDVTVAIVRKVFDTELLIESPIGLTLVDRAGVTVEVGNTVAYSPGRGVLSVLSETPIRIRDFDSDDDNAIARFRVPKTEGGPTFDSFGGYPEVVARARELIETQLNCKQQLDEIGARPIKGILFTGPPGTGKTLLAQIVAQECDAEFFAVSGPAIVSKWLGDSESLLRRIFEAAESADRAIVFFDEIDSLAEKRDDDTHEASKRLVAQLLTLMDGFDNRAASNVVVIAATNRVNDIDPALLRPGRFDWQIEFGMPTRSDRIAVLLASGAVLKLSGPMPFETVADRSDGWSAAKLTSIWTEAALVAAKEARSSICDLDFAEAFERVAARPSMEGVDTHVD